MKGRSPLPSRPNLEQYKKQAKDLVKACRSGDSEAVQRIKKYHPRHNVPKNAVEVAKIRSGQLIDSEIPSARFALADAQLVIAREYGFESWPKFAKHLEGLTRANSPVSEFEAAADAIVSGDLATLERLLRENPGLIRERSTRAHRATLLHYVAASGIERYREKSPSNGVEIAKVLLKAGAEVDAVGELYGKGTTLVLGGDEHSCGKGRSANRPDGDLAVPRCCHRRARGAGEVCVNFVPQGHLTLHASPGMRPMDP